MPAHLTPQTISAPIRRMRFVVLAGVLTLWLCVIGVKLVWVQIFQHSQWMAEAAHQQTRTIELAPRRGVLYDRNLHELAMTALVDSVFIVPNDIKAENMDEVATMLAQVVHIEGDEFTTKEAILGRMRASPHFAWVARKMDPDTAARVKELPLKGMVIQQEFKRFYPDKELAAQVLGYVGTDDAGLGGLELKFDDEMHGVPGHMIAAMDARRKSIASVENEPAPGEDLVLTIDQNIQFIAERALDASLAKNHALRGTVVVEDPHTGEILALATRPTFDPNNFRHVDRDLLMNRAVSDVYEPGSTFKLVTYSAALDSAGVHPDDMVDCQGGAINLYGRIIHDDKSDMGMGRVTVQRALEKSSDVAAVKMALKVGNEKFYSYMKAFGFGDRSGIELPSETRGLLRPVRRWDPASIGSLAIGQEVGVTPVQLAAMVSTIANGGTYLPPHVLAGAAAVRDGKLQALPVHLRDGVPAPLPDGARRVISEMTAAQMRKMMEGIVLNGTGKEAGLNGYSSGGKTGTAQKIDVVTHTYSKTKHIASFAGVAPVSNPAITVAVVIDSPEGASYYGSAVSAPVFAQIAQQTLEYLGVPYDREVRAGVQKASPPEQIAEERESQHVGDQGAIFSQIGSLEKDDPVRAAAEAKPAAWTLTRIATGGASAGTVAETGPGAASAATMTNLAVGSVPAAMPAGMVPAPQLVGKPLRVAMELLMAEGLQLQAVGSGLARSQSPPAGTPIAPGAQVQVRFSR